MIDSVYCAKKSNEKKKRLGSEFLTNIYHAQLHHFINVEKKQSIIFPFGNDNEGRKREKGRTTSELGVQNT